LMAKNGDAPAASAVRVSGTVLRDGLELRCSLSRGHHLAAKRELLAGSVVLEARGLFVAPAAS